VTFPTANIREIRERVLASWAAAPARFREDANAEEDYALGGYRDRVVVELAQNAADAALRAGVPGRLRLTLSGGTLTAANAGAPLDAQGVEALSTLRASAKRDDPGTTGRFGVGFAAVVAVCDTPQIVSGDAGVEWSVERTRALVAELPGLAGELAARGGAVPALRLPFAVESPRRPPEGFDTVVRLPLRDAEAERLVRDQLDQVGAALMLALPALRTVEIRLDGTERVLTAEWGDGEVIIDGVRWLTVERGGPLADELLADRPTEERFRPYWQVRWARSESGAETPRVLHAPTPSDERLGLPALLLASFPLAPDRRHVAPGQLTDFLVERAADAYLDLMRALPFGPGLLDLVPGPLAVGELDAGLRRAVLDRLPGLGLADRVVVDGPAALLGPLGEVMPGLLPAGWPVRHPGLEPLGIRRMPLADVVDALAGLEREPSWWREVYAALAGADTDGLGALPVPLADGRTVRGPRGLLLATPEIDPADLGGLGLRFVHQDAADPLLLRLGAVRADPRVVLADPGVRSRVAESLDLEDEEEARDLAESVLSLVAAAHLRSGDEPWLADLALTGEDGEIYPAGELLLPDSPLLEIMAEDAPFGVVDADLARRFGPETLEAAGVLGSFAVVRAEETALADVTAFHLDGDEDWVEDVLARLPDQDVPPMVSEFSAVRDLELVADWHAALDLLARPPLRAALTEPAHVLTADGGRVAVPSYTAWWLGDHPVLDGRRPRELRTATGDPLLAGLYDPAPAWLDPELARALGVRTTIDELLEGPDGVGELLARMAEPGRTPSRPALRALWTALATAAPDLAPDLAAPGLAAPDLVGPGYAASDLAAPDLAAPDMAASHLAASDLAALDLGAPDLAVLEGPGASAASGASAAFAVPEPPARIPAVVDGVVEVVAAVDALVLDRPDVLPLMAGQPLVIAPYDLAGRLAELLDLPLAGDEVVGQVESEGVWRPVPALVTELLPGAPETCHVHEDLVVDGHPVPWWYDGETLHVTPAGLARGVAWAARRWEDRLLVEAALGDPGSLATLLAEADLAP
jgi:hypothetical protein